VAGVGLALFLQTADEGQQGTQLGGGGGDAGCGQPEDDRIGEEGPGGGNKVQLALQGLAVAPVLGGEELQEGLARGFAQRLQGGPAAKEGQGGGAAEVVKDPGMTG
jgi:hypothetical protein